MNEMVTESDMVNFNLLSDLEEAFLNGKVAKLPTQLKVNGIMYHYKDSTNYGWEDFINGRRKAMSAFHVHPNADNMKVFQSKQSKDSDSVTEPQRMLVLLWGADRHLRMVPAAARFITPNRQLQVGVRGVMEGIDIQYEETIILHNLGDGRPIQCKIDTGADMCSLHAEDIQVHGDSVSFVFNGKKYRMPIAGHQHVKQADSDIEARPTVRFDMELAGTTINGVECNLNDRSGMASPMLVGKNLLSQADFTIHTYGTDDGMDESISQAEWEYYQSLFEDVQIPESSFNTVTDKEVERVIKFMLESNCSLRDVIYHIKEDSLRLINEDITY